ncbi:hypothetical protein [Streptomyces sp. NPDC001292]|uniref:hypothetical protein n=1 Tax=Streptomyces sp. NPDC001292 TaxID=3364558 RepID=UPI00367DEBF1
MRIEGLAQADGSHVPEDVGDVLLSWVRISLVMLMTAWAMPFAVSGPVCAQVVQGGHEDASDGLQGEGVVARIRVDAAQRGDRDDDPLGDVHEQRGHPRFVGEELAGGLGVAGLDRPEVFEGAEHRVRGHRGERHSGVLKHRPLPTYGPPR